MEHANFALAPSVNSMELGLSNQFSSIDGMVRAGSIADLTREVGHLPGNAPEWAPVIKAALEAGYFCVQHGEGDESYWTLTIGGAE